MMSSFGASGKDFVIENHLIVFTRFPEPGKAKTRLIPALGPAGAAKLQALMTENTLNWAKDFRKRLPVALTVAYEGGLEARLRSWLGGGLFYRRQCGGDLGARMAYAIQRAFSDGAKTAVVIGTDIPNLSERILKTAFDVLTEKDLVLGPSTDGGYYLLGVRSPKNVPWQDLFRGIPWGTTRVLSMTLEKAGTLGLSFSMTPPLSDVDEPENLPIWATRTRKYPPKCSTPRISIVIPVLNEARSIEKTLWSTLPMDNVEIVVVDGESRDETVDIARRYGVRLLTTAAGRGPQLNAGARVADGSVFIFLHADTRLPPDADSLVRKALADASVAAGAFSLSIDAVGKRFRIVEKGANIRSRYLGLPYGDQAIFMRRRTFQRLGGFPEIPVMEDFVMMNRARRLGRVVLLPQPALTSGRRWLRLGVVRTTLINQRMLLSYALGLSPLRLSKIYRRPRR